LPYENQGATESPAMFVACNEKAANELVGQYNLVEHNAYHGLHHGRINPVFEIAGFLCRAYPELAGPKRQVKSSDTADAPVVKKTSGKRGRGKKSTRPESHISALEFTSARPVGHGKKSSGRSSGLKLIEKASLGAAGGKPKCTLNLFASNSSTSGEESASPRRPRKRPRESSLPKQAPESAPVKDIFYCFACYLLCSMYYV
jgi:hypothetical protein